ncbi:MAG: hypothetical protein M3R52_06845 [Acidobacteriota bacterium]|nr:hypothetical protein [Acidobacteriota bacterium]
MLAGLLLSSLPSESVNAQQPERRIGEKWEYCAITGVLAVGQGGKGTGSVNQVTGTAKICYFQGSGCRKEVVEASVEGSDFAEAKRAALAKAAAKLGEEGWEMLGEATFEFYQDNVDPKALYFRRRQK